LYTDDLLDQVHDPNVFKAWLQDLDNKGVNPDSDQLAEVWTQAMGELAEGNGEDLSEEEMKSEDTTPVAATRSQETLQTYTAPGGDWANTLIRMEENPVMDRYLRNMKDKREGRSRVSRKIEVEDEIANVVDQTLDHFAGDMLPGEISSNHVKQFVEDEFPEVSWQKVYEAIQKIADPKRRHEEDPKERTNQEANRRGRVGLRGRGRVPVASRTGLRVEAGGGSGLRRYKEIDACCHGTGEKDGRCCGVCHGSGQIDISLTDEDHERKNKIASKLGGLLVVSVDVGNRRVSPVDRRELSRVTRTRVANKGTPLVFKHSTKLMQVLMEHGIPYRTANYQHPRYRR
jgi:hypothetical protein